MLSTLYRVLTDLGSPLIDIYMHRRLAAGREDGARFGERFGYPSKPRPAGRVVWCHAASVGEAVSLLMLIEKLHDIHPDISVLLTTGTVTGARVVEPRLPSYAIHQYVPIDLAGAVARFLDHWQPSMAVRIESEIWPNTLRALRQRSVPVILLNARMSDKSFHNWQHVKGFAAELMSSFSLCLAQTDDDGARFMALGAKSVKCLGNLKYAASPLPVDARELAWMRQKAEGRPLWLMASTHRGEEQIAITTHQALAQKRTNILTIIVPRHPTRGDEIALLLKNTNIKFARRSQNEMITADTQIYLADTMSELGLFYALCPIVVVCGSFVRVGGHNPIESAQLGAAILLGPHMYNAVGLAREFVTAGAAIQLQHANEIPFVIERLLNDTDQRTRLSNAARLLADQKRHILDQIILEMAPFLAN